MPEKVDKSLGREGEPHQFEIEFTDRQPGEPPRRYWTRQLCDHLLQAARTAGVELTPNFESNLRAVATVYGDITGGKEEREGTDGLTGLRNHRAFWSDFREIVAHVQRREIDGFSEEACLLVIDIDDFKRQNDTHGLLWGDQVLINVAHELTVNRRQEDITGRTGGEEFAIVLLGCPLKAGKEIAERLRKIITKKAGVTVSIGLADRRSGETPEELFEKANLAMRLAKGDELDGVKVPGNRKNRVVVWAPSMPRSFEKHG